MKRNIGKKLPKTEKKTDDAKIRLNKYISNSGVCSRREADTLIAEGKVTVNGKVVTEMGYKLDHRDDVNVNGKRIKPKNHIYILLNKPKGYLSTTKDPQERKTVMDLVASATTERVYPVGRLDKNTTGLLLLTNDGDLNNALVHPSKSINKIYSVGLDKPLTKAHFIQIVEGAMMVEEEKVEIDELAYTSEDKKELGIRTHKGSNSLLRKLFESLEYKVEKLDRVMFGILTKKDLPRGKWRLLTDKEVRILKQQFGSTPKSE
ncbi:MAG: rRNA pseudouridine synthase [Sphingobacteriales bacterium]|nr:MAG: rRNA pseudouridine synthase [Sphingobacteriales bacterium]